MKIVNIGFGNIVCAEHVVAVVSPESAPIKRVISDAREEHRLIDATYGRRTKAVIITDSQHVILSALQPETMANRMGSGLWNKYLPRRSSTDQRNFLCPASSFLLCAVTGDCARFILKSHLPSGTH